MKSVPSLQSIRDRFETVNNLIIEHPSFDCESRSIAAIHSVLHMRKLTEIVENCNGCLTQDAVPALSNICGFLDFVENYCKGNKSAGAKMI